jgi:ketosteroid isomerase-like protein
MAQLDPDIEWVEPPGIVDRATVTGPQAALESVSSWTAMWGDYEVDLLDVLDLEDGRALAILKQRGRGAGSGVGVESDLFMLWSFRDGAPVRMEMYLNRADAEAAAGSGNLAL